MESVKYNEIKEKSGYLLEEQLSFAKVVPSLKSMKPEEGYSRHGVCYSIASKQQSTQSIIDIDQLKNILTSISNSFKADIKLKLLETEIEQLKERINNLECEKVISLPVESFLPEPFDIIKPFKVTIRPHEGEFLASFLDAQIHTSGETIEEAYENIKDLILITFEVLSSHKPKELGILPSKQISVLKSFIKRSK